MSRELEDGYNRDVGSGTSTDTAYTVEARINYHEAGVIAGQIFDIRWRRVNFERSSVGVPAAPVHQRHVLAHGMLAYASAQALSWWLHAMAAAEGVWCLETRLIQHRICASHSIEAIAIRGYINSNNAEELR